MSKHTMQNCGRPATKLYCEDYAPDECDKCPYWIPEKPKTHADQLRAKTDEELAQWGYDYVGCPPDYGYPDCDVVLAELNKKCLDCWLKWLKEEADNG